MPPEIAMDLTRAAEQILACPLHDPRLIELWGAFGRELLLLLKAGESKATPGLVADLDVDVMRTDEFTYERFRRSVDLDFDYLSTPTADLNVDNEPFRV